MKKSIFNLSETLKKANPFLLENEVDVELDGTEAQLPEDVSEEAVDKAIEEGTLPALFENYLARTSIAAMIIRENDEMAEEGEGTIEDKELEVEGTKDENTEDELSTEENLDENFKIVLEADGDTPAHAEEKKEDEKKAKTLWEKIKDKVQEIWNKIVGFVMALINKVKSFLNEKLGVYKKILEEKDKFRAGIDKIKDTYKFKTVYKFDFGKAESARQEFAGIPSTELKTIFDKTPDKLTEDDMKVLESKKDVFKELRDRVRSRFNISEELDAPSIVRKIGYGEKMENVTLAQTGFDANFVVTSLTITDKIGDLSKKFESIAKEAKKEHTLWKSFKNGMSSKALKASIKRDAYIRSYFNQQLAVNNVLVELIRSRAFLAYNIAKAAVKAA